MTSISGKVLASQLPPIINESHWVKFLVLSALPATRTKPRYEFFDLPAEIPLDTIVLLVFLPI